MDGRVHILVRNNITGSSEIVDMAQIQFTVVDIEGETYYDLVGSVNDLLSAVIHADAIMVTIKSLKAD